MELLVKIMEIALLILVIIINVPLVMITHQEIIVVALIALLQMNVRQELVIMEHVLNAHNLKPLIVIIMLDVLKIPTVLVTHVIQANVQCAIPVEQLEVIYCVIQMTVQTIMIVLQIPA